MSDYQHCTLIEKTDTDLVIQIRLVHTDAALPSPLDRPSLLRLMLEGTGSGFVPALGNLDRYDDASMHDAAPGLIDNVVLQSVSGLLGPELVATYRITLAKKARAILETLKPKRAWGAAAMVPRRSNTPAEMSLSRFAKTWNKLKVDSRSPEGSVRERVERLQRLLVAAQHPRETPFDHRIRVGHAANMLGDYGADAWNAAASLCDFVTSEPNAVRAVGRIGNPIAIGPIALAFGALVPNTLTAIDPDAPHPLYHFVQYALTTLGWFGPAARPFTEAMLIAYTPLPRQRVPLAFARWRVLGDEGQRGAMLEQARHGGEEAVEQLIEALFTGPVAQRQEMVDAVRADLATKFGGDRRMAAIEERVLKRLAASAPRAKARKPKTTKAKAKAPSAKASMASQAPGANTPRTKRRS